MRHYHSGIFIFTSDMFHEDCDLKGQYQSFSGIVAQHQNDRAEKSIQTMMYTLITLMVHTSLHWTEYGVDSLSIWYFSVQLVVWLYNHIPNRKPVISLIKMLTSTKMDHRNLHQSHVWGCPTYVFNPKLQNDQNIPKRNRCYQLGLFVGF